MPKALLRLNGETFLEKTVSLLRDWCQEIIICARSGQLLPKISGCQTVTDEAPGLGPLGGLASGLMASRYEWSLTLACDLPLVNPEILRLLQEAAEQTDAVVPRAHGKLQPLLAAYSRACLEPAREAIQAGQRTMASMLDRVRVRILEEPQLRQVDPGLQSFINVNTWQEYEAIVGRRRANACG